MNPGYKLNLLATVVLSTFGLCSPASAQNHDVVSFKAANLRPLLESKSVSVSVDDVIANVVRIFPRAGFAAQMVGGEIQGSNQSATAGFVTLARLDAAPREGQWTRIPLKNPQAYRFLRYFGPAGSYSTVAEIEFLSGGKKIDGQAYGTFGSRDQSGNDYSKAFDGNTKTYFDAAAPSAQYLGIEVKSRVPRKVPDAPVMPGNGLRHYHIGNSLTDGMDQYTRELALAAGYTDDWADRQTIPGAPLWINYQSDGGFGTNHKIAFEKFAPISELVMQTFISNSDSEDPEYSLKFYNDARVNSPDIRPWIYGQWDATGSDEPDRGSPFWEERNRALMRIYMAHALNFNAGSKGRKTEVIPGGLGLLNLKQAIETGKVPGQTNFYKAIFSDGLHLTESGRQFISMVIFSSLYNRSPVGLPVVKIPGAKAPEITPEQNKIYQQIAWDTVRSFRKDSGASLASTVPGEIDALSFIRGEVPVRHSRLGQLEQGRSFQYVLNALSAGKYDFKVSARTDKSDGTLEVSVNHQAVGSVAINPNKDQPAADSTILSISLNAGLNTLRLQAPAKSPYQLNSIKVTAAGQSLKNTLPMFDLSVWDEELKPGQTRFVRDFRVSDAETPADKLQISASSDNPALVPDADIIIESGEFKGDWGNVYNRRLTVTPIAGQKGEAWIVLTVKDADGAERQQRFRLRVM
jgi:hypothetical protein